MLRTSIDYKASKKIINDYGLFIGRIASLDYFSRSYSTDNAGNVKEHGDGFSLRFVDKDFICDDFTGKTSTTNLEIEPNIFCLVSFPNEWNKIYSEIIISYDGQKFEYKFI